MKLKGLGKRAYNVLFHTHTVSGIVISFALFVIFYAGAFALFRKEIVQWENPEARIENPAPFDFDKALSKVDSVYGLDKSGTINVIFPDHNTPFVTIYGKQETLDSTNKFIGAYVVPGSYRVQDVKEPVTTVGETIYHLHYFRQIPVVGLYISGLVALFFLFASITGLLIHWKNLFTKFFSVVKEGKWKQIWTNAHTVLGVIGLPFQMMYAVTGAFFGLLTLILLPSVFLLYDGDQAKLFAKFRPEDSIELKKDALPQEHLSINKLTNKVETLFPDYHIKRVKLRNYAHEQALASFNVDDETGISANGVLTMYMSDGVILEDISTYPKQKTYSYQVIDFISKLHFGEFGGFFVKIIYFALAMITCFMIISGVLIWQTARNHSKYSYQQRLFHHRVTKVYLAICLSMFPSFAILFLANKCVPMDLLGRVTVVNSIFFTSWLLLILIGLRWNNYAQLNRNYLAIGGVCSIIVPLSNGLVTQDWIWNTLNTFPRVAIVDLFWLLSGVGALLLPWKVLKVKEGSNKPDKTENVVNIASELAVKKGNGFRIGTDHMSQTIPTNFS